MTRLIIVISLALLLCLSTMPQPAAATKTTNITCSVGSYLFGEPPYERCVSCHSCRSGSDECAKTCFCNQTNNCATSDDPRVNRLSMCASYSYSGQDICLTCASQCGIYRNTDMTPTGPVLSISHGCAKSCVCTAHSQCPTGYYCGRDTIQKTGVNVCQRCDQCINEYAIDRACPRQQCAAEFQCLTNADCATVPATLPKDSSRWCTNNFQCKNCSSKCYLTKSERRSVHAGQPQASMCSKDCCGWDTLERQSSTNYGEKTFMFGFCDSEKYDRFRAYFLRQSDLSRHYKVSEFKNGKLFGHSPDSARLVSGAHTCKITIDENPDAYPRRVPIFNCDFLDRCKKDNVSLIVFARDAKTRSYTTLAKQFYEINTKEEGCNLGKVIATALAIVFLIFVCICAAGVGCIGACIYFCCIRPSNRRRQRQQLQVDAANGIQMGPVASGAGVASGPYMQVGTGVAEDAADDNVVVGVPVNQQPVPQPGTNHCTMPSAHEV